MRTAWLALALAIGTVPASADPIKIVAAENFYGDVAKQIGGDDVSVVSILSNPDDDPHLFEASVTTAKELAQAQIVVQNGVDYDPWMDKLLRAHNAPARTEINVAVLVGRRSGDNPHLWYDPANMKVAAKALTAAMVEIDAAHRADYEAGDAKFLDSLKPLDAKIATMRAKYSGVPVAVSEPVFGYQADLIGLKIRDEKFALAVMNNSEPSASDVAAFEDDLKGRNVKAMLYNAQASEPTVARLVQMAKDNSIPIVGVSETEPPDETYQKWMLSQLDALDAALGGGAK